MKKYLLILLTWCAYLPAQDYGPDLPEIPVQKLLLDFELFQQTLEGYHTGLYWYTPKATIDSALIAARASLVKPMNGYEFFNVIAPVLALSREDHANSKLPDELRSRLLNEERMFPFKVQFIGRKMYITGNGSQIDSLVGAEITHINGEDVESLVLDMGELFSSDGYIVDVKFSDLSGFAFSYYYYIRYGRIPEFTATLRCANSTLTETINIPAESRKTSFTAIKLRKNGPSIKKGDNLEYRVINDTTAYLGVHTFGNGDYKINKIHRNYKKFLKESFADITERGITTLIIDVSQNSGGSEGNENLLYSYLADNYQKYTSVTTKASKLTIDNGVDKPIKKTTLGIFERIGYEELPDGTYARKQGVGHGLMAYRKEPAYKYQGKLYVIIGPVTYSGGSEFANMIHSQERATFVGEATGGGYYGNTSGYSFRFKLPHSKISIAMPALKFAMNVSAFPFGSALLPDIEVIPTFQQFMAGKNAALEYILQLEGLSLDEK